MKKKPTEPEARVSENGAETKLVVGYVLAGGGSTRFGRDKASVEIDGVPLLLRMQTLLAPIVRKVNVIAATNKYAALGVTSIADRWEGQGPLAGIITALLATKDADGRAQWNLIVGCDMPFLTRDWLADLVEHALASDADAVAPRSSQGLEPLCACWRTSAAATLQQAFDTGTRKVAQAMKRLNVEVIDEAHWKRFDTSGRLFWNMNMPADYFEAKRILEAQRA